VLFCLDIRADYSPEQRDNIRKYKLGGQTIYNSQSARKHLETAGAHLDRTQSGGVGERASGLARGMLSMAMAKMSLNISIASLGRGHHIECKDLEELLEAEDTVRNACKNVTRYLDVAATFNGSEIVIEYVKGEEQEHIAQSTKPLLEYLPSETVTGNNASSQESPAFDFEQMGASFRKWWNQLGSTGRYIFIGVTVVLVFLLLRSCM
jgi:hypothetical protein